MINSSDSNNSEQIKSEQDESQKCTPNFDMFARGVATGIVVTTIVEASKTTVGILAKNPLVVLGTGILTGYFAHKYRKVIILSSNKVAEQSKDFAARQKKNFIELLGEPEES